jgi:hypothetical protein
VVYGRDQQAHLRLLDPGDDAAAMVARMEADGAAAPRAAVRRALHLDAWERWARRTGPKLGVELGLETDTICDALEREVAGHCATLERDLAA